ncbi:hypothetical protein [Siminovitchia fortis]|uniref:hypothetical protein n=1 Tax=Siminovitchia fortis TaxID=254758 RepID=UPI00119D3C36|nr:hypothetical protein [Siminovitchia fortis]
MKVQKVTLKDIEIRKVDGEFEKVFINEKTYPAFLTNHSLKRGKELGYIETSVFNELAKLQHFQNVEEEQGEIDLSVLGDFDETKALQVIYLALTGANRKLELNFDEFLEKYHDSFEETMILYANLIADLVASDKNQFANGFKKSTNRSNKKKQNRHR